MSGIEIVSDFSTVTEKEYRRTILRILSSVSEFSFTNGQTLENASLIHSFLGSLWNMCIPK